MSTTTKPSPQQRDCSSGMFSAARGQLQKCLQMLKAARNDNEKMASMLLFTHLMKHNDFLTVDQREVFDAIGASFIVRLLNSKNVPEGCPAFMYKSLAVSVLASFTEQDILLHPSIVSNLCAIAEVLSRNDIILEAPDLCKDSVKILLMFSRTQEGCRHLLEKHCVPVICHAVLNNIEVDTSFEIIKGILHYLPQETWSQYESELVAVLCFFSKKFAECQEMEKFTICDKLFVILTSLCESCILNQDNKASSSRWKEDIRKGLRDILQSRCKIEYKYPALQLASSMIELFGVEWTFTSEETMLNLSNTTFWVVLLNIAKVEVKMILESGNDDEIQCNSTVIVACYRIIEKTIEFLITDKKGISFSNDLILQMHAILVECFDCIMQFLIQLGASVDNRPKHNTGYFRRPIIIATIRVLCAWLSEETNSLSDGVSKVLPVLLDWTKSSLKEVAGDLPISHDDSKTPHEIISYLLPPLCHLSADETFCAILIKHEAHAILTTFFNQLWLKHQKEHQEYPSSLITLCNIFLNFSVLEVELIKNSQVFQDILHSIMVSLPRMTHSESCVILIAHFCLLGLLLFRHRCPFHRTDLSDLETRFLTSAIHFLKQAQISVSGGEQNSLSSSLLKEWDDVSELWFLSIQNLIACVKVIIPVRKILLSSGWVEETKMWLQSCEKNNEKIITELKSALLPLVHVSLD